MGNKKKNEATVIRISKEVQKELEKKKLVPNETYDHILRRILGLGK